MTDIAKIAVHESSDPPTKLDMQLAQAPPAQAINQLLDNPESHSLYLGEFAIVTGQENAIAHKLDRALVGWKLVDKDADARVWRTAAPARDALTHLTLECSANVNVKLVVF